MSTEARRAFIPGPRYLPGTQRAQLPDGRFVTLTWDENDGCVDARLEAPSRDPEAWESSGENGESMDVMSVIGSREECESWFERYETERLLAQPTPLTLKGFPSGSTIEASVDTTVGPGYDVSVNGEFVAWGATPDAAIGEARLILGLPVQPTEGESP